MARKLGITLDDVVGAAAADADRLGFENVTLRSVADALGVRSPSLYAHVQGLQGLRRELSLHAAAAMAESLVSAAAKGRGLDALAEIAEAYRAFALRHPGLYDAAQRAVAPGEDDELYDALASAPRPAIDALAEAGIGPEDRVHFARALRSALHGFVSLENAGGFGMPESVDESFRRFVRMLLAGIAAAAPDRPAAPRGGPRPQSDLT